MDNFSNGNVKYKNISGLLIELNRLAEAGEMDNFNILLNSGQFSGEEADIVRLINKAGDNFRASLEYDLMKYKLANDALDIALWDMDVVDGDPVNPNNKFTWSDEFRQMLGFADESEFPNLLYSWSDRLHPEDKEKTLDIFAAHIFDRTGNIPYDIEYRLMLKDGSYRYFHAFGNTLRDNEGVPLRVAGAIMDITEKKQMEGKLQETLNETIKIRDILTSVLNKSNTMIYVTDLNTDETLFMSDYMKQHYGIQGDVIGQPCYKILQSGMEKRCDFCPCHQLDKEPDKTIVWEERSTVTNRYYLNTDRYVDWPGGKKVHIQYCVDITDIKNAQDDIVYKDSLLRHVNNVAALLINSSTETFESNLYQSMNIMAEAVNVDRMYIWKNHSVGEQLYCTQVYEWSESAAPQRDKEFTIGMPYADNITRWEEFLSNGKCINNIVRDMPAEEQKLLFPQDIVSILVVPVEINGSFWGFVGLDDCRNERLFTETEESVLSSVSLLIANAFIRNELERKIIEANERTALMLDSNPMCCQLIDTNFRKIDCNQEAIRLFGFKNKQEFLDRYSEIYPEYQPDGQRSTEKVTKYLNKVLAEGRVSLEWTYRMLDGTLLPTEITMLKLERGEDYVIASYARDLREEIRLKKEVEIMLENAPVGLTLFDENFKFVDCNEAVLKIYGVTKEFYSSFFGSASHSPEFQPDGSRSFNRAMEIVKKVMDGETIRTEWTHCMPDGKPLPVELTMTRMNRGDKYIGLGYIYDMRDQMRLQGELESALNEAQVANRAKSDFLARMSHDMRTPLNAVIGMSELSLESDGISEEERFNIEKIHNAGMTLLNLVNDILDVSKIEAGKLELMPAGYDVPSLINDTIVQNILRINDKPIKFEVDISKDMYSILHGDELRIKQIMNNLLSNAIKFTKEGTVKLSVHCVRNDNVVWLTIQISDTGRGIRPEDMDKLFVDYSQMDLKPNDNIEGTGLGLSIVKKLVELMDGSISVESEYGKGSVFTVKIAQEYLSEARIGPEVVDNLQRLNYSDKKRDRNIRFSRIKLPYARVLVVDDNLTNLDIAKGLMKFYGMQIDCVTGGQEAIDAIRDEKIRYNAVFMDYMMPGIDGVETTRIIRGIGTEYTNNMPIIALTANAIVGSEQMFLNRGFQAFLSKPIDIARLDEVIRRWVRNEEYEEHVPDEVLLNEQKEKRSLLHNMQIAGLNIGKGIERYGGDVNTYLGILRSYVVNTRPILERIKVFNKDKSAGYIVDVHGIKGSSRGIYANAVGDLAERLETEAGAGNFSFVAQNNDAFLEIVWKLINDIEAMLSNMINESPNAIKNKPDKNVLLRILSACENFKMDELDSAMEEINQYVYETDSELVSWLKGNVSEGNFSEIRDKILAIIEMY
ncbi:MAG: ATP-binding protein [Lachnospiraceae bacterium]|nr:ATP-binding protein [Lachnospiraceae bacterium]